MNVNCHTRRNIQEKCGMLGEVIIDVRHTGGFRTCIE